MAAREPPDRFFTRPDGVRKALSVLAEVCGPELRDAKAVIEPSAGSGAFLAALAEAAPCAEILAYDLAPMPTPQGLAQVTKLDFLKGGKKVADDLAGRAAIVAGNPPYGRNSALAVRFINACAALPHVDVVGFILPLAFTKASVQRRVRRFVLERSVDLNASECTFNDHSRSAGAERVVPSCFQVWRRGVPPPTPEPPTPRGWTYVKNTAAHRLQVIRAGGQAGRAFVAGERHAAVANYFLTFGDDLDAPALASAINERRAVLLEDARRTTAAKSLAKPPLTMLVNALVAEALATRVPT